MAQLTLSQRGIMANDGRFQQRLTAALKKTANYWATYTGSDSNTAMYKRKQFAKNIQSGSMPNMQAYCEYFLSQYNEDPAIMDGEQLADSALTESPATPIAYDYFAGVEAKDIS